MADFWVLCKKNNGTLIPLGADTTEQGAKDLADDGGYVVIPVVFGRKYPNIISESMVGAVAFSNLSLYTVVQQAKNIITELDERLDGMETQTQMIISQGQQLEQAVTSLAARIMALEDA